MPRKALTTCTTPGCPELVEQPGRCTEHRREAEARRGGGGERGSTGKWKRFRKRYLGDHPVCECRADYCPHEPGLCRTLATDIDHIDGSGRNGPRAYDPANLLACCHSCHSRKTYRFDGSFGR